MGGSPLLALSIAAFPESLPNETLAAIFGAADEQVRAAGGILAGGHTLRDDEPKYGLAVVGTVHPDGFWPKSGARPGDALFLTKPLGTGMLLHAAREGRRHEEGLEAAMRSMTILSREAADVLRPFDAERGHRRDRLRPARPRARDGRAERRPDRARRGERCRSSPVRSRRAAAGVRTGGDSANRDFAGPHVEADGVPEDLLALAYDPQTSGGLLIALPADKGAVLDCDVHRARPLPGAHRPRRRGRGRLACVGSAQ